MGLLVVGMINSVLNLELRRSSLHPKMSFDHERHDLLVHDLNGERRLNTEVKPVLLGFHLHLWGDQCRASDQKRAVAVNEVGIIHLEEALAVAVVLPYFVCTLITVHHRHA